MDQKQDLFVLLTMLLTRYFKYHFKSKNKNIYNIGQNNEVSIKRLIEDISKILKIKVIIEKGKLTAGSVKRRCPDMSKTFKIKKLSNNYLHGLKKTVYWYKNFFLNYEKK